MFHRAWFHVAAGCGALVGVSSAAAQKAVTAVQPDAPSSFLWRHQHSTKPRGFGVLAESDDAEDDDVVPRANVKAANAAATARARQFLEFGDERFREQQYLLAYGRYKKAAQAAPDLPDAYLRQGMAQIALGRYAPAAESIKRGLALETRGGGNKFRLDRLYGENRLAQTSHLERLAEAAWNDPQNADLTFLVGIVLFFDGQTTRARLFFERAADLGEDEGLLKQFLSARAEGDSRRGYDL